MAALCDYDYARRMSEALDERMCLTVLNFLIKPVANLRRSIKICEILESK